MLLRFSEATQRINVPYQFMLVTSIVRTEGVSPKALRPACLPKPTFLLSWDSRLSGVQDVAICVSPGWVQVEQGRTS